MPAPNLTVLWVVANNIAVMPGEDLVDDSRYKVIDLFAGCGGLTEGFRSTERFRPVAAVEMNPFAAATYALNHGEDHVYAGDIRHWLETSIPKADVVIGGPPCQGFFSLGM